MKNMKKMRSPRRNPRGFMALEAAFALIVLGILLTMFVTMTVRQQQGLTALKAKRDAARLADQALLALRTGGPAPDAAVRVRPLPEASETPGRVWVEVTATVSGHSASLIGLVPGAPKKEPPHAAP
jgi:type II secretory pathway pseudopilin PulG